MRLAEKLGWKRLTKHNMHSGAVIGKMTVRGHGRMWILAWLYIHDTIFCTRLLSMSKKEKSVYNGVSGPLL